MRTLTLLLMALGAGAVMLARRGPDHARGGDRTSRRAGESGTGGSVTETRDGYVAAAAVADQYAREAAALADRRSRDPQVQAYAEMLAEHHADAAERLRLLVAQAEPGRSLPGALDARRQVMIDALAAVGEAEFDEVFLAQQVEAHREALALHERYAAEGEDESLVEHASEACEALRRHLETAQGLQAAAARASDEDSPAEFETLSQAGGA